MKPVPPANQRLQRAMSAETRPRRWPLTARQVKRVVPAALRMNRVLRMVAGTARVLLLGTLIAGFAVVPGFPAQAAACAGTTGVTVVVDFGAFGGGVQIRCASGDPATGLAALDGAGFDTEGTVSDGSGFVCRIDGKPGQAEEPCVDTPPGSKSWSYWHAPRGGSWTYSSIGAAGRKPPQGTVEGWAYGNKAKPSISPPVPPAPPPATTKKPAPGVTTPAAAVTLPLTAISPDQPASGPSGPATINVEVQETTATPQSLTETTNFTGAAVGIGLVALLAITAAVIARRRRRIDPGKDDS